MSYIAQVNFGKCKGCGKCVPACKNDSISLGLSGRAEVAESCIGCGECVKLCLFGALILNDREGKNEHTGS